MGMPSGLRWLIVGGWLGHTLLNNFLHIHKAVQKGFVNHFWAKTGNCAWGLVAFWSAFDPLLKVPLWQRALRTLSPPVLNLENKQSDTLSRQ